MQHHREQNDDNEQPLISSTLLVDIHEILSQIHRSQVKHSESVDDGNLLFSEILQLISIELPDNLRHKVQWEQVSYDDVEQVWSSESNNLENHTYSTRDDRELEHHHYVHQDQEGVEVLR
jgi:hypothetical protein